MADLLFQAEIDDIRETVAPSLGDEAVDLVEVWRRSAAVNAGPTTSVRGGGGVNVWGVPITEGASPTARTDLRSVLIATYPARLSRVGVGTEPTFGGQPVDVGDWMVEMDWGSPGQEPDVQGGDHILVAVSAFNESTNLRERIVWQANTEYARGALVQPAVSNGWSYRCAGAGQSDATAPAWPRGPLGATFADGSARWAVAGLKWLEVVDPSSRPTYAVSRIVRCREVT